jgi:hypothetical protein
MMKRGSLAGFASKKDPAPTPATAEPAEVAVPSASTAPVPTADKRRGQTLRLSVEAWRQLKRLAVEQDKPAHDLLVEAVNALFSKHNLPPIA